ncbi:c-type cytochrome [uncultured Aliiroseovarius sp.]|uniref:c-type cytochrome n=1 Tax=uncultured Aliiroseovarius sp. TaxID=1658783 RepID=UPI002591746A|nr:c-type cytochrome [uncultured Aliiroseovarius sp.]
MIGLVSVGTAVADDLGKGEYLTYCASCHGADAMGGGAIAEFMSVRVPDLTKIAERNDGAFPFLDVVHMVDGRSGVMAHGTEMPVWGDRFTAETGEPMIGDLSAIYEVRGRVLSLVSYLESIQK